MAATGNPLDQAKQFWTTRTGQQKAFLLGGAALTVLLLVFFSRLIGTPDYKPLFSGLDPEDAQSLSAQLDAQGIPHQTSADGKTISVPADRLDAARMQTAAQGAPHSGHMGFELFDKMSWGQTEFDEKVTYQRALEGELERSIETLADVQSARVHLVMPTDSVFLDQQRGAKASVILKLRRGQLSKDAAMAIANLVSGAVDQLKPGDISIVDADTDRSLGPSQDSSDSGATEEATLSDRLMNTLEPIVGAGKIRASVNVSYDQGTTEESQEKYDPTVSALLSDQKSEDEASGNSVPSGVTGASANVLANKPAKAGAAPAAPAATKQPGPTQTSKTENAQYGVNKTIVHTVTPAGRIERITAAILVDDAMVPSVQKGKVTWTHRKRTQQEMDQIRDLAEAAIGFDPKRGDTISVQNMAFDTDAVDTTLPPPTLSSQVQKAVVDYGSILRPVSLLFLFLLVYLFVLRPVQKHVLATPQLTAKQEAALPAPHAASAALGASQPLQLEDEKVRAAHLKDQTVELIRQKPQHTARAVQAWLREEPS